MPPITRCAPFSPQNPYRTDHFRLRLRNLEAPLKDKKHIRPSDYDKEKVKAAIARAEMLHRDKSDLCPAYFATTVYILLNKMMEMLPENDQTGILKEL